MKRMTWTQAMKYVANLQLGGHTDWRLPSVTELRTLWDDNLGTPIIPSHQSVYWSATAYAGYPYGTWGFDFYNGRAYGVKNHYGFYVRCVRGDQLDTLGNLALCEIHLEEPKIAINGDGTILDKMTGLVWEA